MFSKEFIQDSEKGFDVLTLRQQIGQMLIMGFAGTEIDEQHPVKDWLNRDGIGGVLLFDYDLQKDKPGKNLINQQQIKQLTAQLKRYARDDLPLYIALDYEGGAVDRLHQIEGCRQTLKPIEQAELSESALRLELAKMAEALDELGFNLNFAPVLDLNLNDKEGIIGRLGRSFSAEPHEVVALARIFVEVFADYGLTCCYKHFPGHGSAIGDTHLGFVDVTDTFEKPELEPYSLLFSARHLPAMVMTAHVINRQLDESGMPATLSKTILSGLLRQTMGFEGVIISDDLQMQAIASHYSLDEALGLTINAGADMLIFANQLGQISAPEIIDKIEYLVLTKVIDKGRIEQAYQRIAALKQKQLASVQN